MSKIKSFIKTTLMGGALVVLPIVVLLLVFNWLYEFVTDKIKPITYILSETTRIQEFYASIAALVLIILIFFIVGILLKTSLGRFTFDYFDRKVLVKLPLYKIIRDTTKQLFGSDKMLFKHVALVNIWGNDTRMTAFITEAHDDGSYTVFVPSGPAPTAGFIFHLSADKVQKVNYPVDKTMKTILSFGAGSKELINSISEA
ncbi:MAG: DUF502 domain-containing protein [Ignavibacteria bacterium]|nr:DUF502 domain-containing protein [Ignavibacteria bacterium]MBT8381103.1 DUF502 domain-containing protein [Ignavibacteria bacterium]MBT8392139.1 DUF502 domain-containing protein [Ignavibacteria bacterium]NNJ53539.1 DUF502 domain-containing protein [Ignavibacteriaceae bacterium]NNL20466.1 DUF502 domain-containing protein [Ignavibacteriaceae bacterium]